jgi:hypothetical protein
VGLSSYRVEGPYKVKSSGSELVDSKWGMENIVNM